MWRLQRSGNNRRYHTIIKLDACVFIMCSRGPVSLQVGKSVQKKRASKSRAVEQLAEKTIFFTESIASLSGGGVVEGGTKPAKTTTQPHVERKEVDATNGQGKRKPEDKPEVVGKKVLSYYLPCNALLYPASL